METAPAAQALLQDLAYIREVISRRATSNGELRRLSGVIRRILVDGDLINIASPRVGKLLLCSPDRKAIYATESDARICFFASGGAPIFGLNLRAIALWNAGKIKGVPASIQNINLEAMDRMVEMRVDNFLSQRVLCLNNFWISRRVAIKHIANYGSGVHSQTPDTNEDKVAALLRTACEYNVENGQVKIHVLPQWGQDSAPFLFKLEEPWQEPYPTDFLDPVLLEVLAAGVFLANSPGVRELEQVICTDG